MIIFYIFLVLGLLFILMGLITIGLKRPAKFFSNFKSIEPKDYKPYNLRVGLLWIGFGLYLALLGLLTSFIDGPIIIIPIILGIIIGLISLMVIYSKLELNYKNR